MGDRAYSLHVFRLLPMLRAPFLVTIAVHKVLLLCETIRRSRSEVTQKLGLKSSVWADVVPIGGYGAHRATPK